MSETNGSNPLPTYVPLDSVLNPSVQYLPRVAAEALLGISTSYLRRDCGVLMKLQPKGFNHQPNARGYVRSSLEVLWEFRYLVRSLGRRLAIQQINVHMEFFYEQRRQRSNQGSPNPDPIKWATPPSTAA